MRAVAVGRVVVHVYAARGDAVGRPVHRVDRHHPFHLTAKIGMARCIDNVYFDVFIGDRCILGHDGDALLALEVDPDGAAQIAARSRGTPRIANRLLRRVRDYAQVRAAGKVTPAVAQKALDMLDVDAQGFDVLDRKLLLTIIEKFDGGPVGVDNLAAAIGEEKGTIEDVLEPYLIQQGFVIRTPRGRMATRNAYLQLGLQPPQRPAETLPLLDDGD